MKKYLFPVLALVMAMSFTNCGDDEEIKKDPVEKEKTREFLLDLAFNDSLLVCADVTLKVYADGDSTIKKLSDSDFTPMTIDGSTELSQKILDNILLADSALSTGLEKRIKKCSIAIPVKNEGTVNWKTVFTKKDNLNIENTEINFLRANQVGYSINGESVWSGTEAILQMGLYVSELDTYFDIINDGDGSGIIIF